MSLETSQNLIESLSYNLTSSPFLFFFLVILGTALWGDAALIFFVAFSVIFKLSLINVFLGAIIGTLIGDSAWFLIGKIFHRKKKKFRFVEKGYSAIEELIERVFKNKYLLALTIVKFLYGTRVITIFYLAKQKINYKQFFMLDIVSSVFWALGIGFIGYLVGIGFVWIKEVLHNIQLATFLIILFFILFHMIQKAINNFLKKKNRK